MDRYLTAERTRYLPLVGRVLIGGLMLMGGLSKVSTFGAVVGMISSVGLPLAPLGAVVAIVVEFGCGLLLLLGFQARTNALILAVWCIVTAAFFHNNLADRNMLAHFVKNVMLAGGLLQIVHFGAGAFSLDARRART